MRRESITGGDRESSYVEIKSRVPHCLVIDLIRSTKTLLSVLIVRLGVVKQEDCGCACAWLMSLDRRNVRGFCCQRS